MQDLEGKQKKVIAKWVVLSIELDDNKMACHWWKDDIPLYDCWGWGLHEVIIDLALNILVHDECVTWYYMIRIKILCD
jgi:hypothetical protein